MFHIRFISIFNSYYNFKSILLDIFCIRLFRFFISHCNLKSIFLQKYIAHDFKSVYFDFQDVVLEFFSNELHATRYDFFPILNRIYFDFQDVVLEFFQMSFMPRETIFFRFSRRCFGNVSIKYAHDHSAVGLGRAKVLSTNAHA